MHRSTPFVIILTSFIQRLFFRLLHRSGAHRNEPGSIEILAPLHNPISDEDIKDSRPMHPNVSWNIRRRVLLTVQFQGIILKYRRHAPLYHEFPS